MSTIQAAPAATYPVGETIVPSKASQQTFASRTVAQGEVQIPATGLTDPNTAVDFTLELMQPDNTWIVIAQSTAFGFPAAQGGWLTRSGQVVNTVTFSETWDTAVTVKGIRLRIDVRDAVPGSGLATPASLGAITLTWN